MFLSWVLNEDNKPAFHAVINLSAIVLGIKEFIVSFTLPIAIPLSLLPSGNLRASLTWLDSDFC